jgi:hypothetical protein
MVAGPAWPERLRCALRRVILLLRPPAGLLALVGLLLALLVHVTALRGIDSEAEWPQVWLLHGAVFPLILLAVLATGAASRQRTPNFRELLALIPWPALLLIGLALIYVLATFVLFIPESAGGAPIIKDGRLLQRSWGGSRSDRKRIPLSTERLATHLFERLDLPLSRRGDRSAVREASSQNRAAMRLRQSGPIG